MAVRINNNMSALQASHSINRSLNSVNKQIERLASGLRVNRAADDAAGLSIREGMRAELAGLRTTVLNAEQGANLIQTAEGSLNEVSGILTRMRELAVQASSSTVNDGNRESLQAELRQLIQEVDRISVATRYNNNVLLTGFGNSVSQNSTSVSASATTGVANLAISGASKGVYTFIDNSGDSELVLGNGMVTQSINMGPLINNGSVATGSLAVANFDRLGIQVTLAGLGASQTPGSYSNGDLDGRTIIVDGNENGSFQVGPVDTSFNRLEIGIRDMRASGDLLGLGGLSIDRITQAREALDPIDRAIQTVAQQRGNLGSFQNRLNFTIAYTENEIENIQASEASISDTDMAEAVTELSRSQILLQSSNVVVMHANLGPANLLDLL